MTVKALMSAISSKLEEQQKLLKQLDMWDDVKSQGIDCETVKSFGFKESYVTSAARIILRRQQPGWMMFSNLLHRYGEEHFNYVRLKDDRIVALKTAIKRPEHR
jgi:hypothetical protein